MVYKLHQGYILETKNGMLGLTSTETSYGLLGAGERGAENRVPSYLCTARPLYSLSQALRSTKASKTATTRTVDSKVVGSQCKAICVGYFATSAVVGNKVTKAMSREATVEND